MSDLQKQVDIKEAEY